MDAEMNDTGRELASKQLGEAPAIAPAAAQVPGQMALVETEAPEAGSRVADLQAPCPCGSVQPGEADMESYLSHTVRTQLTLITLLSTNLDLLYDRLEDEKRRQMIRDLREQARLLNGLVISALEVLQRPE